jgi:hypothetical protein
MWVRVSKDTSKSPTGLFKDVYLHTNSQLASNRDEPSNRNYSTPTANVVREAAKSVRRSIAEK